MVVSTPETCQSSEVLTPKTDSIGELLAVLALDEE